MPRIAIVGGALQGMECTLLCKKAGFESVVIDRRENAPALSLADDRCIVDPIADPSTACSVISGCDAVIPACEEIDLLDSLVGIAGRCNVPLLFDPASYRTSCSKLESNRVMAESGVPLPIPWPECGFPAIVKPSSQSGSIGVTYADDEASMQAGLEKVRALGDSPVVQEFVTGKSVSVEVVGNGSEFVPYVTTEVILDGHYDCKRVVCDKDILGPELDREFADIGRRIASVLGLSALMDVEAILTKKGLRVLEIDARVPSQTPAAIEAATGVNILERLYSSAVGKDFSCRPKEGSSVYCHLVFKDGVLRTCGEKEFAKVRAPSFGRLFGSDLSISDYAKGSGEWRATMIFTGKDRKEAESRYDSAVEAIRDECGITEYVDEFPEVF